MASGLAGEFLHRGLAEDGQRLFAHLAPAGIPDHEDGDQTALGIDIHVGAECPAVAIAIPIK